MASILMKGLKKVFNLLLMCERVILLSSCVFDSFKIELHEKEPNRKLRKCPFLPIAVQRQCSSRPNLLSLMVGYISHFGDITVLGKRFVDKVEKRIACVVGLLLEPSTVKKSDKQVY